MSGNLLTICEQRIIQEELGVFSSSLNVNNYFFSKDHSIHALLIEGINQFSVRAAVMFSGEKSIKFLPSFIKKISFSHLLSLKNLYSNNRLIIKGSLSAGNGHKSFLCTFNVVNGSDVLVEGEVLVSPIQSISVSDFSIKNYYDGLSEKLNINLIELHKTNFEKVNSYYYEFSLNMNHPLFLEHFPDKPILPGSLAYDFIIERICKDISHSFKTILVSLKFILPISDSNTYFLEIIRKSDITYLFHIKTCKNRYIVGEIKGILS